jgi:hypothetical protein
MASLTGSISSTQAVDSNILSGVKRSRLSLHFNTFRVRRWLLVQLVSIPVAGNDDEYDPRLATFQNAARPKPESMQRLVEDYQTTQFLRTP